MLNPFDLFRVITGFATISLNAAMAVFRRIRVTVHVGYFQSNPNKFVFINVVNLSPSREIEIVGVWFEARPRISVIEPTRALPKRLRPDESWETWVRYDEVSRIPAVRLFNLARVRISTGTVIASVRNRTVPPAGTPAGD
jgi:hypothetical protein